jgi:hypothetical protein
MNLQWVLSHDCGVNVAKRPLDQSLTTSRFPVGFPAGCGNQKPVFAGLLDMELAGLEPATSWVRSSRPLTSKELRLQRFMGESLECRNISRNSLHRVLQMHEILDRSAGATEKERGRAPPW